MAENRTVNMMGTGDYNEIKVNCVINLNQDSSQVNAQMQSQGLTEEAQNNPTVIGKLVGWGKSLGDAAAKTTVSEVVKELVKLALRMSGIELPWN